MWICCDLFTHSLIDYLKCFWLFSDGNDALNIFMYLVEEHRMIYSCRMSPILRVKLLYHMFTQTSWEPAQSYSKARTLFFPISNGFAFYFSVSLSTSIISAFCFLCLSFLSFSSPFIFQYWEPNLASQMVNPNPQLCPCLCLPFWMWKSSCCTFDFHFPDT